MNNVKLDSKQINEAYFVTYVSTSWQKDVATSFMEDKGLIMEVDESFKNQRAICCDVSWISKFPDECEVLFARNIGNRDTMMENAFKCEVLDETQNVQRVGVAGDKRFYRDLSQSYRMVKMNEVMQSKWI